MYFVEYQFTEKISVDIIFKTREKKFLINLKLDIYFVNVLR